MDGLPMLLFRESSRRDPLFSFDPPLSVWADNLDRELGDFGGVLEVDLDELLDFFLGVLSSASEPSRSGVLSRSGGSSLEESVRDDDILTEREEDSVEWFLRLR